MVEENVLEALLRQRPEVKSNEDDDRFLNAEDTLDNSVDTHVDRHNVVVAAEDEDQPVKSMLDWGDLDEKTEKFSRSKEAVAAHPCTLAGTKILEGIWHHNKDEDSVLVLQKDGTQSSI